MFRTHRSGKGPMGCGGWGLGSMEQKGPTCAPHTWSQRAGDLTWDPNRLSGHEWVGKCPPLLSYSSGLGGPLPPASPDLPGLLLMPPRTYMPWRGLWRAGHQPESSAGSLGPSGQGTHPLLLSCSSRRALSACLS